MAALANRLSDSCLTSTLLSTGRRKDSVGIVILNEGEESRLMGGIKAEILRLRSG